MTEVTGINNAVQYCDPNGDNCTAAGWPSAAYSGSGGFSLVTDDLGQVTRYSSSVAGLHSIRLPNSPGADSVTIGYGLSGRVSSVSNAVGAWHYTYADSGGQRTTTVRDPLLHTRVVVSDLSTMTITSDTNGTGDTTTFQYDANRRVTQVTMPEGNSVEYDYDDRGNILETRVNAKSGSGLPDIVTTAAYGEGPAVLQCANPRTCNQPTSTTDARGFQTDFTYDSTHGGVLSVTQPAPSGSGARPETRYEYEQKTARYYTAPGNTDPGSPVYRLTRIRACASGSWSGSACADGAAIETRTTIAYPSAAVPNNLLPTQVTRGAGDSSLTATVAMTYDSVGNVETVDGPLAGAGDTTRYYYDSVRQRTGVVGPDSGSSVYRAVRNTYNAVGQISVAERGTVSNQSNNPWGSFSALWRKENAYNSRNFLERETIVSGGTARAVTQYAYDTANRLECTAARINPATFASLPASACTGTIVAQGVGPDRITRNSYDNANRPTKVTQGYGSATPVDEWTATYTTNRLVQTIADAGSNLTTYVYDGFDRVSRMRYPLAAGGGSSTSDYEEKTYDDNGNVTVLRRRDTTTLTNTYDNLNRLTTTDLSTLTRK